MYEHTLRNLANNAKRLAAMKKSTDVTFNNTEETNGNDPRNLKSEVTDVSWD